MSSKQGERFLLDETLFIHKLCVVCLYDLWCDVAS